MKDNENENNAKTNTLLLTVIGVATLMVAVIGATFAYFTAQTSTSGESASTINLTAGSLTIAYDGGTNTITGTSLIPQAAVLGTKTFTITGNNTTPTTMYYNIQLVITENTFVGQYYNGDGTIDTGYATKTSTEQDAEHDYFIEYTLTGSKSAGTGALVDQATKTEIRSTGAQTLILGSDTKKTGSFVGVVTNQVHTYTFSLYFNENGKNQDVDKNKTFAARIEVVTETAANAVTNP